MLTVLARLFKPAMNKRRKDAPAPEIEAMEESINEGSGAQGETQPRLELLPDNSQETKKDQAEILMVDALTSPAEPKIERQVPADTKATSAEEQFRLLLEKTDGKEETEAKENKEKVTALGGLFDQQEKEVNPLRGLIDSMVDVSARELVEQARGIKTMILEKTH